MNEEIAFREIFIPEDMSCPCVFLLLKPDPCVGSIFWGHLHSNDRNMADRESENWNLMNLRNQVGL